MAGPTGDEHSTDAIDAPAASAEARIAEWRHYLQRRQAIRPTDVEELEDHLRDQMAALQEAGLDADEAFLVAVRRMGALDALSREFAREHSERLWKQLVSGSGAPSSESDNAKRTELVVVFSLAAAAAAAIKLPELFGVHMVGGDSAIYARNLSLFVLPLLTAYFAWKRRLGVVARGWLVLTFVGAAVFANVYPLRPGGSTERLITLHLPIALWLAVGVAYTGRRWGETAGRMDFVRFSGELFIYYVLIALGGGVLSAFTVFMFRAIGLQANWLAGDWLLPCGSMGAVIIGAWLVEAKQNVIENMAPVLTRVFTPLLTAVLLAFLVTMAWTGRGIDMEREVLIAFDLLLALVLGLLLYALSAREPEKPPDFFDILSVVLVISALIADAVALAAIAARISEFGFTPNRTAALGENVILLVNLAWSARLYLGFLGGRRGVAELERWQTAYLPVYSAWAAVVVVLFPPVFAYA